MGEGRRGGGEFFFLLHVNNFVPIFVYEKYFRLTRFLRISPLAESILCAMCSKYTHTNYTPTWAMCSKYTYTSYMTNSLYFFTSFSVIFKVANSRAESRAKCQGTTRQAPQYLRIDTLGILSRTSGG